MKFLCCSYSISFYILSFYLCFSRVSSRGGSYILGNSSFCGFLSSLYLSALRLLLSIPICSLSSLVWRSRFIFCLISNSFSSFMSFFFFFSASLAIRFYSASLSLILSNSLLRIYSSTDGTTLALATTLPGAPGVADEPIRSE